MNIRLHFVPVHVDIPYLIKTVMLILIQCIANPLYIAYVNITFIRGIAYKNTPANVKYTTHVAPVCVDAGRGSGIGIAVSIPWRKSTKVKLPSYTTYAYWKKYRIMYKIVCIPFNTCISKYKYKVYLLNVFVIIVLMYSQITTMKKALFISAIVLHECPTAQTSRYETI